MVLATALAVVGLCASLVVPQVAGTGDGGASSPSAARGAKPRTSTAAAVAPVTPAEFEKLLKDLVPRGAEPWETIPWRSDLLAARDEAIRAGRPLFLWAMNGHPLGCT